MGGNAEFGVRGHVCQQMKVAPRRRAPNSAAAACLENSLKITVAKTVLPASHLATA